MEHMGKKAVTLYSFDEELGYDWLIQEDESTGSAYCGCTITRGSERFGDESITFKYCDMHRSAGETLESLKEMEQAARALWFAANKARAILR